MFPHFDQSEYAVALQNAYRQFPAKDSTLDLDFINSRQRVAGVYGAALDGVTFTRSTTATYFGADGLLKTAAINEPRFEYDPVSLRPLGLLIEEARTNLLAYSEQFSDVYWTKQRTAITADSIVAPDGQTTADTITGDGTSGGAMAVYKTITASPNTAYTISVYVKAGTATWLVIDGYDGSTGAPTWFNLSNGTIGTVSSNSSNANIASVGNGWYRCSVVRTTGASATSVRPQFSQGLSNENYVIEDTKTFYLWGAQCEQASFLTSYIPTTTTALIRSADVASMTGANFSSWYNQTGGVMIARFSLLGLYEQQTVYHIGRSLSGDRISVRNEDNILACRVIASETGQAQLYSYALQANVQYAHVLSTFSDDFLSVGNGIITSDLSGAMPVLDFITLGSVIGNAVVNAYMQRFIYIPKRLPNNLLQYLSRLTA